MSTNQHNNHDDPLYDEDDVENYVIYEEDDEDDNEEDWDWEEENEDEDEEEYVYVDEDGNILGEDDQDYYIDDYDDDDDDDHEYYDEESEMNELIELVSGNNSKTNENNDLSDSDNINEHEYHNDKKTSQIDNEGILDNENNVASSNDNDDSVKTSKRIQFDVKQKISEFSNKVNVDEILEPYDSFIGNILGKLGKIPFIGKLFTSLGDKKILSRLSPVIIIGIILSILFGISFITSPDKNSVIPLPDMGEITVTSKDFDKDNESMNVIISNTGDVIIPANATLSLYTYNPTLNPLTIIGFEEIGKCEISNIIIDIDKEEEYSIPCDFISENTVENVKYRTIVSYQEDSE